jgi:hypothetical protein
VVKRGIGKINEKPLYGHLFVHKKMSVTLFPSYPVTLMDTVCAIARVEE